MKNGELKGYIEQIVGERLDEIKLACEMMMFSFGRYALHSTCLTRIVKDNDIITTTQDWQSWDGEDEKHNDEWYFADMYRDAVTGGKVTKVEVTPMNDVRIEMDNGVMIELFIANGYHHYGEENEQWVFFKSEDESHPFITVYPKYWDAVAD